MPLEEEGNVEADTQGRRLCEMGAGIGVMGFLAKDHYLMLATPRSQERGMEKILLYSPQMEPTHFDFRLLASRTVKENKFTLL